jgi:N-acetylglucosamine kinase-like BadF-type ATPase
MKYIIGVDGGGTKTIALIADLSGNVLARSVSGPSNYNAVGFDAACVALESVIATVQKDYPGEVAALCLGLAGVGRAEDVERFKVWAAERFPRMPVQIVNDAEILLAVGSSSGPALALICGTGSIAYGRTIAGELIRAGGWGYLFGDEGSGYAIGAAALRAVMQDYDGREAATVLTELILQRRGLSTPPDLVRNIYGAESPRSEVAALSEVVEQAAGENDAVAIAILNAAANKLTRMLAAVLPKLGPSVVPLVISGGTIIHGLYLKQAFVQACEAQGLRFAEIYYIVEPAEGALRLAKKLLRD